MGAIFLQKFNFKSSVDSGILEIALLALGAVPGSLIRWQVDNNLFSNLMGTFILGLILGLRVSFTFYLIIGIGFCGALTTFSGWIVKCFLLI